MNCSRKEGHRFYIDLPANNEISYAKLVENYYEDTLTSQNSLNEEPDEYPNKIKNLIARGETFGISSKNYKYVNSDSESEDTDSYSSSFIEKQTEASYFSSDEFDTAVEEGFYVVRAEEIRANNTLKRTRDQKSEIPEKITVIIEEIKKASGGRKLSWIPKKILDFIQEIEELIKELETNEKIKIYKEIAQKIGVSCKQIESEILKSENLKKKKASLQAMKSTLELIEKLWSEMSKKLWNQDLESLYQKAIQELKHYIELSKNCGKLIEFDIEKEKLDAKIKKKGILREGFGSQPIQIV